MEATLSLCWFTPGWMYFGHIGDSRIYYLPAQARQRSSNSAMTTRTSAGCCATGKINEREARTIRGATSCKKPSAAATSLSTRRSGVVAYESGDMFLLCTDGLIEGLYDSDLADCLRSPESLAPGASAAHRLIDEALARNARDNVTALVVRVL